MPLSIEAPFGAVLRQLSKRLSSGAAVQVLELGSGGIKHAQYLVERVGHGCGDLPRIGGWQLSDIPRALPALQREYDAYLCSGRARDVGGEGAVLRAPIPLAFEDAVQHWQQVAPSPDAAGRQYDMVFTANTLHVAPWRHTVHMLRMLPVVLRSGGCLIAYGPFHDDVAPTTVTTQQHQKYLAQFDRGLQKRFGKEAAVRSLRNAEAAMRHSGLESTSIVLPEGLHFVVATFSGSSFVL